MIATPGTLRQFAAHAHKQERFCWRMSMQRIAAFVRFSKHAIEHQKTAESIKDFIEGEYHDASRD